MKQEKQYSSFLRDNWIVNLVPYYFEKAFQHLIVFNYTPDCSDKENLGKLQDA